MGFLQDCSTSPVTGIDKDSLVNGDFLLSSSAANTPTAKAEALAPEGFDSVDFGNEIGSEKPSMAFMQQEFMAEFSSRLKALNTSVYQVMNSASWKSSPKTILAMIGTRWFRSGVKFF